MNESWISFNLFGFIQLKVALMLSINFYSICVLFYLSCILFSWIQSICRSHFELSLRSVLLKTDRRYVSKDKELYKLLFDLLEAWHDIYTMRLFFFWNQSYSDIRFTYQYIIVQVSHKNFYYITIYLIVIWIPLGYLLTRALLRFAMR